MEEVNIRKEHIVRQKRQCKKKKKKGCLPGESNHDLIETPVSDMIITEL